MHESIIYFEAKSLLLDVQNTVSFDDVKLDLSFLHDLIISMTSPSKTTDSRLFFSFKPIFEVTCVLVGHHISDVHGLVLSR